VHSTLLTQQFTLLKAVVRLGKSFYSVSFYFQLCFPCGTLLQSLQLENRRADSRCEENLKRNPCKSWNQTLSIRRVIVKIGFLKTESMRSLRCSPLPPPTPTPQKRTVVWAWEGCQELLKSCSDLNTHLHDHG